MSHLAMNLDVRGSMRQPWSSICAAYAPGLSAAGASPGLQLAPLLGVLAPAPRRPATCDLYVELRHIWVFIFTNGRRRVLARAWPAAPKSSSSSSYLKCVSVLPGSSEAADIAPHDVELRISQGCWPRPASMRSLNFLTAILRLSAWVFTSSLTRAQRDSADFFTTGPASGAAPSSAMEGWGERGRDPR